MQSSIGHLPGDRPGYWGPVTGFDFCERNYDISYHFGEFWNTWTNWMSLPVYLGVLCYLSRWDSPLKLTALTKLYISAGFLDMFFAGMSHLTLRLFWTQIQEATLTVCFLCGFVIIATRYDGCPVTKAAVLFVTLSYLIQIGYGAMLDGLRTERARQEDHPESYVDVAINCAQVAFLALWVLIGRGDTRTRVFIGQGLFMAPAFFIFGITAVSSGQCMALPIWLHELGHFLGACNDYMSLVLIISLDPHAQESFRLETRLGIVPVLRPTNPESARPGDGTELRYAVLFVEAALNSAAVVAVPIVRRTHLLCLWSIIGCWGVRNIADISVRTLQQKSTWSAPPRSAGIVLSCAPICLFLGDMWPAPDPPPPLAGAWWWMKGNEGMGWNMVFLIVGRALQGAAVGLVTDGTTASRFAVLAGGAIGSAVGVGYCVVQDASYWLFLTIPVLILLSHGHIFAGFGRTPSLTDGDGGLGEVLVAHASEARNDGAGSEACSSATLGGATACAEILLPILLTEFFGLGFILVGTLRTICRAFFLALSMVLDEARPDIPPILPWLGAWAGLLLGSVGIRMDDWRTALGALACGSLALVLAESNLSNLTQTSSGSDARETSESHQVLSAAAIWWFGWSFFRVPVMPGTALTGDPLSLPAEAVGLLAMAPCAALIARRCWISDTGGTAGTLRVDSEDWQKLGDAFGPLLMGVLFLPTEKPMCVSPSPPEPLCFRAACPRCFVSGVNGGSVAGEPCPIYCPSQYADIALMLSGFAAAAGLSLVCRGAPRGEES